jgi:hypothetical protein
MKVVYQARDGKVFETSSECAKYENEVDHINYKDAIFIRKVWEHNNYVFKEIPIEDIVNSNEMFQYGDCIYIPFLDTWYSLKAQKAFKYSKINTGLNHYAYDCDDNLEWNKDLVEEFMEKKKELEEKIEDLERATFAMNEAISKRKKENPEYGIEKSAPRKENVFEAINDITFEGEDD